MISSAKTISPLMLEQGGANEKKNQRAEKRNEADRTRGEKERKRARNLADALCIAV